ncbi:MAG: M20/M25/M40 family metallo-hydrolase, partial [Firmicutes bacterium]|nr:M20/M25/M40 family metallo-hydrolase [Bacillota bacterium]
SHQREFNGYFIKSDEPIIKRAVEAAGRIKLNPALEASGGGSDANILNEKGVKSVVLGVGFKNPHSKNESMDLNDLVNVAELVFEIATL